MAKPTNLAVWGGDTNFSSGPESGSPVKVEPSAGAKAQGWVPGQPFRGPRLNWWQNTVASWIAYLDNLPAESAFLGAAYTWTAAHVFSGGSDHPSTTRLTGASNELTYSSARTRAGVVVPIYSGSPVLNDTTQTAGPGLGATGIGIYNGTNGASPAVSWFVALPMPVGAVITGWAAIVDPDAASACTVTLLKRQYDMTSTTLPAAALVGSVQTSSGGARQPMLVTGLSETVTAGWEYYFVFSQGAGIGYSAQLHALEVTYTETRASGHY